MIPKGYKFSKRSYDNMKGIDPRLIVLLGLMIKFSPYDFVVSEGLRTLERQKQLYKEGKSKTLNSKHLVGKAFDIAILINNQVTWEEKYYIEFARIIYKLGSDLNIPIKSGIIEWGWDCPHFELK